VWAEIALYTFFADLLPLWRLVAVSIGLPVVAVLMFLHIFSERQLLRPAFLRNPGVKRYFRRLVLIWNPLTFPVSAPIAAGIMLIRRARANR